MDSREKTLELIEQALETVRPYLHADGGDVKLVELTDDLTVRLELQGSCQSCPMSAMTFRAGLEESIRKAVPHINRVVASNVPSLA
ncbi:NifU family protein [Dyadobacter subterraneus]|jgi:Fe-S cluster biogenesis protein NfuA|uniref:Fe-S cluster biogenesis protein NfuA, 4Fe-4S-binding domain n=2 Tax=Dyadobacter TaxID=120831 RepID=A0A1H6TT42_9BACT|nr:MULTISPECIES: NifU family protein [Dyadobacter]MBE9461061.1 NifU family protein [Dyadobacter subterraneus]MCF0059815.1 NifU family protein [Dyadobacter sp. CY356]SEI78882.1 Fe-S cluster biogenesis protein NfuA, 4Fe-4S-binding domain [Dyadobacter koreensis]